MDMFSDSRRNRDASPFDRAILGPALRAMMDELALKVPRGDSDDGLPHPGYVRRGRPPLVTPQIAAEILELRAAGLGYKRIARATGISVTTVRRVLRKKAEEE
jgi:DNA invertase Pin-like site-specific DNA recombinase